jgi:signal peptidase
MPSEPQRRDFCALVLELRTSENPYVAILREALWVGGVVGGLALILFLFAGTWPAAVTIESESMVPHMNVGDLVIVVQKDRFGEFQTWTDGKQSGYTKFGDFGDVLIYRPNGANSVHPIIHRAMEEVGAGQPVPVYINPARGRVTPSEYLPLLAGNTTVGGFTVLYTGTFNDSKKIVPGRDDLSIVSAEGRFLIPSGFLVPGAGYLWVQGKSPTHPGYITKGDNNFVSDQGGSYFGIGVLEPVKEEWVVGKALVAIPLIGYLPLHIVEVAIVVFGLMILYELYLRRKEGRDDRGEKSREKGKGKKR